MTESGSTDAVTTSQVGRILERLQSLPVTLHLLGGVALVVLPLVISDFYVFLLTEMLTLGLFALGFGFLYGFSGVVSFGHALYYGLGAYAVAMLAVFLEVGNFWLILLTAIVAGGLAGLVVSAIATRSSGVYFAIITLGFAEITRIVFRNYTDITGGSNGLSFGTPDAVLVPGVFEFTLTTQPLYYMLVATLVLVFLLLRRLVRSPFGAILKGVRENPERLEYLGYNERYYRIAAFSISAAIGGLAGAYAAIQSSFVSPQMMHFILSGELIIWTVLGGKGLLVGPIVGAAGIRFAEHILSQLITWWFIPIGLLFVAVVIFLPEGVLGRAASVKAAVLDRYRE